MPLANQLRSVIERSDVQEALAKQGVCQGQSLGDIKDGSGYSHLNEWGRNTYRLSVFLPYSIYP